MKLLNPFKIGSRLLPALQVGDGWLSYDLQKGQFVIDLPDGQEYWITDFRPAPDSDLQGQFCAILSFLLACAESREYAFRYFKKIENTENGALFPENVGKWAEHNSNEISILQFELSGEINLIQE